ncbi:MULTISPECIES: UDP-N-acetylmuramate dehydrogenase [Pseudomonadati]|uniref:UDP-N-acetylmuramate dehydrogenase n=1 Tax=unclassified Halobacteriovorax TaxID=2639665 RepID=UPI000CD1E193|nr:UDP-N-acetylmuramate dehydrogenase [Halobacteriovorax sp. DA5]POB13135.1 UDP-N-acetylenolpyruvoylglucosamine reductase [Halobacteriovorax sp. DA5]
MNKIEDILSNIQNIEVEIDKDLSKYSTMRLQSKGDLITVKDLVALKEVVRTLTSKNITYMLLGLGANQLLNERIVNPIINLDFDYDRAIFNQYRESYILPASVKLSSLTSHASKFGNKGWEVITGIPATLGGAVFMNAGTGLGWISEIIACVWYIDKEGNEYLHEVTKDSFSYRQNNFLKPGDVVYKVELVANGQDKYLGEKIRNYLLMRNKSQPLKEKTCGSVFKNIVGDKRTCTAGQFIDILNLKGLQVGDVRVSNLHGNFMENFDKATASDVKELIKIVQDELYLNYGLKFEPEVRIDI